MLYQQLVYRNTALEPGENTIRLVVNGNTNSSATDSFFHIDKIVYTPLPYTVIDHYDFEDVQPSDFSLMSLTDPANGLLAVSPFLGRTQATGRVQNTTLSLNTNPDFVTSGTQSIKISRYNDNGVWDSGVHSRPGVWMRPASAVSGTAMMFNILFDIETATNVNVIFNHGAGGSVHGFLVEPNTWYTIAAYQPHFDYSEDWFLVEFAGIGFDTNGNPVDFAYYIDDFRVVSGIGQSWIELMPFEEPNGPTDPTDPTGETTAPTQPTITEPTQSATEPSEPTSETSEPTTEITDPTETTTDVTVPTETAITEPTTGTTTSETEATEPSEPETGETQPTTDITDPTEPTSETGEPTEATEPSDVTVPTEGTTAIDGTEPATVATAPAGPTEPVGDTDVTAAPTDLTEPGGGGAATGDAATVMMMLLAGSGLTGISLIAKRRSKQ